MSTSAITMVSAVTDVVKVLRPKTVAAPIIFSY
ncbi:Protein of unknown function [Bacillus cereus]|nr:Protein of unknown function [Bacillus cereus]